MKVCVASSVGGHLREILQLEEVLARYDYFFVVNDETPLHLSRPSFRIAHAERDLRVLWNFVEAFRILRRERPDVIISTGAGPAVPVGIVGRLLGATVIHIETFSAVERPSMTGRIMYRVADHFYYQWPALGRFYPRGTFAGSIF